MTAQNDTHSVLVGYALWVFGFTGSHRFYYGRPITGTIWFFTLGLLGVGWLIDVFFIPHFERTAERRYSEGKIDFNLAWLLLTFLGFLGIHRFYMGKVFSGLLYLCSGGIFTIGIVFDYWTLNQQISEINET